MRLLHTSDWHLGQSRQAEDRALIVWLLEQVSERQQLSCYQPFTPCQFDPAGPSFFSSANLAAMVGLPRVSFLTVRSSALSLARRRLLADL